MSERRRTHSRVEICGVICVDSKTALKEFYLDSSYYLERDRKLGGLPFVKIKSIYYYPVGLCHRFYAGEDITREVKHFASAVRLRQMDKIPQCHWFKVVDDR